MWEVEELLPTLAVAEEREWLGGVGEGLGGLAGSSGSSPWTSGSRNAGSSSMSDSSSSSRMISASSAVNRSIAVFRECTQSFRQIAEVNIICVQFYLQRMIANSAVTGS